MTRSVSPRFWLARIRPVVVAVTATAMVALAACSSTVPSTSGGSATSSARASTPLVGAVATQLDAAIGQAMTTASIPGAIVGIWGPAGNYVRTFGVADKATGAPMSTDMYSRIGSVTKTFTITRAAATGRSGEAGARRSDLEVHVRRTVGRPDHAARAGPDAQRTDHIR